MSDNDRIRASITATLAEIAEAQQTLGIPPEPEEWHQLSEIVQRIERRLAANRFKWPAVERHVLEQKNCATHIEQERP